MDRTTISENVKRRLYAESMGRCMNPDCKKELFSELGDIIEKAHIRPYCATADNSFENLIVLCPNCHTHFDKNFAFKEDEVKQWKQIRANELNSFFSTKYYSFNDLKEVVRPLLLENKMIYENYYLKENKDLWNKFENRILVNNRKLKEILSNNLDSLRTGPSGISIQPALFHISSSLVINLPSIVGVISDNGYFDGFEVDKLDSGKSRYFGVSRPKHLYIFFR